MIENGNLTTVQAEVNIQRGVGSLNELDRSDGVTSESAS